jgi:FAD/FMN-containing dehydrogenase
MNTSEFKTLLGDMTTLDKPEERELYSHDIGDKPPVMTNVLYKTMPDLVVQPKNTEEIKKVLSLACEHKMPVVVRGAASWGGRRYPDECGHCYRPFTHAKYNIHR